MSPEGEAKVSEIKVNVDGPAMQAIVAAAILQQVGPEKRDELMTAAIKHLMTPGESRGYGYAPPRSPLQQAFEEAVRHSADRIMHEEMEKPEYKSKLQEVVREAMMRSLEGEPREAMVVRLAGALSTALTAPEK